MPTQDQYMDFLKDLSYHNSIHIDITWFNKETKDKIEYINKNADKISDEKWEELFATKDSAILYTAIKNPNTPSHILEKAIDLSKNERDILAALTRDGLSERYIKKIYDNNLCWDILHKTICHQINENGVDDIPYLPKYLNYIAEKEFNQEFDARGRWEILSVINDEQLVEKLVKSDKLNEWKVDWLLKNPYISDGLKNNIFDAIGFNYNDISGTFDHIKNPTSHMIDELYRQAIDTLDFVDNGSFTKSQEKVASMFARSHAEERLMSFHREGFLTDAMCYDLISRKINSKDSHISDNLIYTILKTTKSKDVLLLGTELKSRDNSAPYDNHNMPIDKLTEHFNAQIKKIDNELKKGRTYKQNGKIPKVWLRRFCSYVYSVPYTPDDFNKLVKYYENDYSLMSYLSQSKNAKPESLQAIIDYYKRTEVEGNSFRKLYPFPLAMAKINLVFKKNDIPHDKIKLYGALWNISERLIEEKADITDFKRMEFLYKDYKRWTFDKQTQNAIKELCEDKITSESEKKVFEFTLKIIDFMNNIYEKDKEFNPKENTPIRLFSEYNKAISSITFCHRMYQVYNVIDESMDKYLKAKEELVSRGLINEKEREKEIEK